MQWRIICITTTRTHIGTIPRVTKPTRCSSKLAALADFVGGKPEEIVFGANATTLAYHVSRTLARELAAGDEIVITELDHHANVGPWQALARERDCPLRVVRMDTATGQLDWNDFEHKVNDRTRVVAVGAASNALGTINDVTRATRLAHSVGALRLRRRGPLRTASTGRRADMGL